MDGLNEDEFEIVSDEELTNCHCWELVKCNYCKRKEMEPK